MSCYFSLCEIAGRVQQLTSEVSSSVGKETQPIRSEVPGDPPVRISELTFDEGPCPRQLTP
jgi:hypothetical protein